MNIVNHYPDYYKWKLVSSILKSMNKFPIYKLNKKIKERFDWINKDFVYPDEVSIITPPSYNVR